MKIDLSGTAALVTGSTSGIGHAIAKGLAAAGANVEVNGRTEARVEAAVAKLADSVPGARIRGVAADVSTAAGCQALIAAAPEVDILVNNAGIFEPKDFIDIPDEDWVRFFEVNVLSGVRLARAYLPGMLKRNWGRIIFISSESALNIPKEMIHYGTTKTAQLAVSRGLAEMTRGTDVTVNSVLPGAILTERQRRLWMSPEYLAAVLGKQCLKHNIAPEEVARLVLFLASDDSRSISNQSYIIDGGWI